MYTAKLTPSDKSITWRQRQASMDETGDYWVHGLAVDGEDVTIHWHSGYLQITGDEGETYEIAECNSFCEAEAIIEHHCMIQFDHETVRWSQSPGLPPIRRPIERNGR